MSSPSPGKVGWDDASQRLVVADTNNDRILIADLSGAVSLVVGGGEPGLVDGSAAAARFHQPQGVCIDGDAIYVADNENHAIRRIDLPSGEVSTIAGTGIQMRAWARRHAPPAQTDLNSPWDVAVHDGQLYVAMAGIHQIWRMELGHPDAPIATWAGSRAEGIVDGPRVRAELAQPSGLAVSPDGLTFADSESSGVRQVGWDPRRQR